MSDHSIRVVRIEKLEKHPNADRLQVTKVGAFQVVVNSEWKEGQYAAYVEPDSLVPTGRSEFDWLAPEARDDGYYRVRAKKLRGTTSFGLLVPAPEGTQPGDDVTELLGIKHYDPPSVGERKQGKLYLGGEVASPPSLPWISSLCRYDIENLRKFPDMFEEGEAIVLTEKLDGCLPYGSRILLSNGSYEQIGKLVNTNAIGTCVLGMDSRNNVTSTQITGVSKKVSKGTWLKITAERTNSGKGGHKTCLTLTDNHKVWVGDRYLEAGKLSLGKDKIYTLRSDYQLSPVQEQVILGKLLGDGSLSVTSAGSMSLNFSHRRQDEEYLDWTIRGLGGLAYRTSPRTSGYGTEMVAARTSSSPAISKKFGDFVKREKKIVPEWVATSLTPLALAFWYMDDGSLSHNKGQEDRVTFATCAFTEADCKVLQQGLERLGVGSVYYTHKEYSYLRLNSDDAERFFILVAPYIISCMQRKLPERYRRQEAWLPLSDGWYKPSMVPQNILSIEPIEVTSYLYDLMTDTGNFFANRVLVHNSNMRVMYWDNQFHVGSRNEWKKEFPIYDHITEENIFNQLFPYKKLDETEEEVRKRARDIVDKVHSKKSEPNEFWKVLRQEANWLEKVAFDNPGTLFYGELFGNAGKIKYSLGEGVVNSFRVFDICKDGMFLPHEQLTTPHYQRVKFTPTIAKMDFKLDDVLSFDEGMSYVDPKVIREGVVVTPRIERTNLFGRVKAKVVSATYLEKYK